MLIGRGEGKISKRLMICEKLESTEYISWLFRDEWAFPFQAGVGKIVNLHQNSGVMIVCSKLIFSLTGMVLYRLGTIM